MSVYNDVESSASGSVRSNSFGSTVLYTFADIIKTFREQRAARKTERALSELSDHVLRDIGISRSGIPYIARQSATQETRQFLIFDNEEGRVSAPFS
jgi:uncharacterized protein YjiS (DUF1127 family)